METLKKVSVLRLKEKVKSKIMEVELSHLTEFDKTWMRAATGPYRQDLARSWIKSYKNLIGIMQDYMQDSSKKQTYV